MQTELKKLVEKLKEKMLKVEPIDPCSCTRTLPANLNGRKTKRAFIVLPSMGCEYALRKGGNCTPCGALIYTHGKKKVLPELVIETFKRIYSQIDFKQHPIISLCSGGSFLSHNEIPKAAKKEILQILESNPYIKKVVIESMPKFITKESVKEITSILKSKQLEIGIGLDAVDDYIRTVCINKNITLKEYKNASKILNQLNIDLLTYVHIKPPFLSETEGIQQAIETARYAFSSGSKAVSLEPISVMKYTVVEHLYKKGLFKPAWLWSVIEVLKNTYKLGEVRINMNDDFKTLYQIPRNRCEACYSIIRQKFIEYNETLNINIFDDINCACKKKWQEEISATPVSSLKERVRAYLE